MKKLIAFLVFFCSFLTVHAQDTTYVPAEPPFSVTRMALHYYSIKWTDEQWKALAGQEVELVYLIDKVGEPFLQASRGLPDQSVQDSFSIATGSLPYFTPARQGGVFVESIYSIRFSFPAYQRVASRDSILFFNYFVPISREELAEKYVKDYNAVFLDFNLNFLNHLGTPGSYLKSGVGFDVYIGGNWNPHWGAALAMGVEFNGKQRSFPDDPIPGRLDAASGVWVGGLVNHDLKMTDRGLLSVRGELAYGALNAANRIDPDLEEGWVQYRGLHTGVHFNFAWRFSRFSPNPGIIDEHVTARYSAVNFTGGLRYRYYGNKEGTGAHFFIGVGYRLGRDDFRRR
ncbi:hypothetical protein QWY85_07205 [Neolewinella lacunae]|uniref:Uncharacterized protein n=1 Tax=Neolewinella lacunae TaxID=1517758 RepID=A0A923PIQ5_9BACT|nr:hypothetical protein [Neolewinella lacunae]MBC6994817.1 hypothetical protein [Neolewinella lacunae]MDN3634439.1 hypothetical protein [Neolewinella lacunae]